MNSQNTHPYGDALLEPYVPLFEMQRHDLNACSPIERDAQTAEAMLKTKRHAMMSHSRLSLEHSPILCNP